MGKVDLTAFHVGDDVAKPAPLPGNQIVNMVIQGRAQASAAPTTPTVVAKFIQFDFSQTVAGVGAGGMRDSADRAAFGWFLESVQIDVWLETTPATLKVTNRLTHAEVAASAPTSANGSSHVNNAFTYSAGANIGTFDGAPMGGVNFGISASESQGFDYPDFSFRSMNGNGLVRQRVDMAQAGYDAEAPARSMWTKHGPPFMPPDTWWIKPPPMAMGDIKMPTTGLFQVPSDQSEEPVALCVSLAAAYVYVDAPPSIGDDLGRSRREILTISNAVGVDMREVTFDKPGSARH